MDSPCVPLAPARRAFQLQTAAAVCHQKTRRPSSRVPPSVQGGRLPPFFFSCKKKGGAKVKCALRKSISLPAGSDQRRRLWKTPPFEKGGRKLYRPLAGVSTAFFPPLAFVLRLVSNTLAVLLFASFSSFARRKRSGGWGETPDWPFTGAD